MRNRGRDHATVFARRRRSIFIFAAGPICQWRVPIGTGTLSAYRRQVCRVCGRHERNPEGSSPGDRQPLDKVVRTYPRDGTMSDVSLLLDAVGAADPCEAAELLRLVYDDLRRLAGRRLAHEAPGQTLQPTALVHEAYLRLLRDDPQAHWQNRAHFFAAAAEAMRRILVEQARRKRALKHGGRRPRQALEEAELMVPEPREDLLALDEA